MTMISGPGAEVSASALPSIEASNAGVTQGVNNLGIAGIGEHCLGDDGLKQSDINFNIHVCTLSSQTLGLPIDNARC